MAEHAMTPARRIACPLRRPGGPPGKNGQPETQLRAHGPQSPYADPALRPGQRGTVTGDLLAPSRPPAARASTASQDLLDCYRGTVGDHHATCPSPCAMHALKSRQLESLCGTCRNGMPCQCQLALLWHLRVLASQLLWHRLVLVLVLVLHIGAVARLELTSRCTPT